MENRDYDTNREAENTPDTTMVDFDYDRYAEVEKRSVNTRAVAALTLGIFSIILAVPYLPVGAGFGIAGIIFAVLAMKREPDRRGMAIAGLVCSIVGLLIAAAVILAVVFYADVLGTFFSEL